MDVQPLRRFAATGATGAALALLAACGEEEPTGPAVSPEVQEQADELEQRVGEAQDEIDEQTTPEDVQERIDQLEQLDEDVPAEVQEQADGFEERVNEALGGE